MSLDTMMVALCCLALAYAAAHDLAARTIPNMLSLGIGAAGLVEATRHQQLVPALGIAILVFFGGLCAWRASLLGGGDVKLLAAVSLWMRPDREPGLLLYISIAGGVLACIYLALGRVVRPPSLPRPGDLVRRVLRVECRRVHLRAPLPYAVAIAAASILCLTRQ